MSPLHCSTVREELWERAASVGPEPLSASLADHLAACRACQGESRAVRELLEATRRASDPAPPENIWDGFEQELEKRIDRESTRPLAVRTWSAGSRRVAGLAAMLITGFALGALTMRVADWNGDDEVVADRSTLEADIQAELADEAHLEFYVDEIEDLLVAYRAVEHGEAVSVFRRSLPATMVAGPGAPSEADRRRLEQQRGAREQLRAVVLGMLASEIEADRHGFGYLDRRIAEVAGQQFLYFIH